MSSERVIRRTATIVTSVCVAIVAVTVVALARPGLRSWLSLQPTRQPAYKAGDRIDLPPALYEQAAFTLVLFARSDCAACQSAKPGIAGVVARLKRMSVPTIVITSGQHADGESEYVRDLGLSATQLVALDFAKLQLQVVPTLVLVNNTGEVKYAKEGIPSLPDQDVLIRAAAPSSMNR